jgi:hypothetical protein
MGSSGKIVNGTRSTDPNYDGVNVYGDETSIDIRKNVLDPYFAAGTIPGRFHQNTAQ